jgi:hypothetical protein
MTSLIMFMRKYEDRRLSPRVSVCDLSLKDLPVELWSQLVEAQVMIKQLRKDLNGILRITPRRYQI